MFIGRKADFSAPLHGNLVIKLKFIRTKGLRQFKGRRRIRIIIRQAARNHLRQRHPV